jgi:asparagine N-glycosylation enzyme membrane subunit Stt3
MMEKISWLWIGSGLAFIQIVIGFALSQGLPYRTAITGLHSAVALFLLLATLIARQQFKGRSFFRRLLTTNLWLIIANGVIGGVFLINPPYFYILLFPYIHLVLGLGVLSNYAVLIGASPRDV